MPEPLASASFRAPELPGIYNVLFIGPSREELPFKIGKAHNMRKRLALHRRDGDFIVLRIWPTGGPPMGRRVDTGRLAALETQALKIIRAYATDGGANPTPEVFAVPCVKKALRRLDAWAREAGLENEGPRLIWKLERELPSLKRGGAEQPERVESIPQVDGSSVSIVSAKPTTVEPAPGSPRGCSSPHTASREPFGRGPEFLFSERGP